MKKLDADGKPIPETMRDHEDVGRGAGQWVGGLARVAAGAVAVGSLPGVGVRRVVVSSLEVGRDSKRTAFLERITKLVVFGGQENWSLDETWEY